MVANSSDLYVTTIYFHGLYFVRSASIFLGLSSPVRQTLSYHCQSSEAHDYFFVLFLHSRYVKQFVICTPMKSSNKRSKLPFVFGFTWKAIVFLHHKAGFQHLMSKPVESQWRCSIFQPISMREFQVIFEALNIYKDLSTVYCRKQILRIN